MRTVVVLLVSLGLGRAFSQATATPRTTDPELIFDRLGTVISVEASLPEPVRRVFVVAMHEGEVVLDAAGGVRTGWTPLATLPVPLDLPLDTWLGVETYGPTASEPVGGSAAIGSDVVFYLRLSTGGGEAPPDPPSYETWGEVRGAFR